MRRAPGEGSIFKRPDGSWQGYIVWHGRRVYRRGKTRPEVRQKLHEAYEDLQRTSSVPVSEETVEQFLARWLAEQIRPTVRYGTFVTMRGRARPFARSIPEQTTLASLDHRALASAYALLSAEGMADSSLRATQRVVSRALAFAVAEGSIAKNPSALVPQQAVEPKDRRRMSPDEIATMLSMYQSDRLGSLWVVMLASGLRWSEAAGLRWRDVNWDAGWLEVRQKVGRRPKVGWAVEPYAKTQGSLRDVAMAPFGWEALRYERDQTLDRGEHPEGETLIWTSADGRPLRPLACEQRWKKFCLVSGMRQHDLRHTAGHTLYALTGDLKLVQDQLGHKHIQTTAQVYARGKVDTRVLPGLAAFGRLVDAAQAKVSEAVSEEPHSEG